MDTFFKYPQLSTLERCPEILSVREVVATEKLHGSNFRVHFPAGAKAFNDLRFGTRNEIIDANHSFCGGRAVGWFQDNAAVVEKLMQVFYDHRFDDVVLYGEICGTSVQRGIAYAAPGEVLFRAFDITVAGNPLTYDLFVSVVDAAGIARVPEIWRGAPSQEAFDALIEKPSIEGERNGVGHDHNIAEGVVIRANPLLRTVFGEWLVIKHKCKKHREATPPRERTHTFVPETEALDQYVATYVVLGRVINAVARLRDAGATLSGTMRDMPMLHEAIVQDLHKECESEWTALTEAGFGDKQIRQTISKVLAGVYREFLTQEAESP